MTSIAEIRDKYPQYADMSDQALADALHKKHYSDMPVEQFYERVGISPQVEETPKVSVAAINTPAPFDVLPFRENQDGSIEFDSNAGLLGGFKRAFNLPGEVMAGKVDPNSPEGIDRTLEMALAASPSSAVTRSARMAAQSVPKAARKAPEIPTAEQLRAAADAGYKGMRDSEVEFDPQAVARMAQEAKLKLDQDGFTSVVAKNTHKTLDQLSNPPEGSIAPISGLSIARSVFGNLGQNFNKPQDAAAAKTAKRSIDKFLSAPPEKSVLSGNAEAAARMLNEANRNYAAAKRSGHLTDLEYGSSLDAAAANSGRNIGNNIRQKVSSTLKSDKKRSGFTEDEIALMENLVKGSRPANATRRISNMLGGGGGVGQSLMAGLTGGAASAALGPTGLLASVAPIALGSLSRGISNSLTKGAVRNIDEATRARSPLFQNNKRNWPAQPRMTKSKEALTRALLMQQFQIQNTF